jgi:hypothetical protein
MTDERLDEIKTRWNFDVTLPMAAPWGKDDVVWLVGEVTRLRAEAQRADEEATKLANSDLATTEQVIRALRVESRRLAALQWQVENEGCAASHLGETTYECRADAPCGLCRLRADRDRLRAALHNKQRRRDSMKTQDKDLAVAREMLDAKDAEIAAMAKTLAERDALCEAQTRTINGIPALMRERDELQRRVDIGVGCFLAKVDAVSGD